MIICVCNNVNENTLEDIIEQKELNTIDEIQKEISVCNQCKSCSSAINDIIVCCKFKKEAA